MKVSGGVHVVMVTTLRLFTHRVADVGQCEPQRQEDGQQEQVGGPLPRSVGPLQRQRLPLLFLILLGVFLSIFIAVAGFAALLVPTLLLTAAVRAL